MKEEYKELPDVHVPEEKIELLRKLITMVEEAMKAEAVLPSTRRKVLARLLYGSPTGNATVELPVEFFKNLSA